MRVHAELRRLGLWRRRLRQRLRDLRDRRLLPGGRLRRDLQRGLHRPRLGDDGCGGSCGNCDGGLACDEGSGACGCEPDCVGKACGADGCGGTCGGCADGLTCEDATGQCAAAPTVCPPEGPYGNQVGDTAVDVVLTDCDGVTYSLHDLCSQKAAWLFSYADW